uniref:Uncharacterized protein n=1 Tax=Anopheles culicifacies TaxID=139723 RepID=A0A182MA24_9DIPT
MAGIQDAVVADAFGKFSIISTYSTPYDLTTVTVPATGCGGGPKSSSKVAPSFAYGRRPSPSPVNLVQASAGGMAEVSSGLMVGSLHAVTTGADWIENIDPLFSNSASRAALRGARHRCSECPKSYEGIADR